MNLAFIGGGGASGVLVLIGLLVLLVLLPLLLLGGVTFLGMKKPKSSVVSFCVALAIGGYLYSIYAEFAERERLRANRKSDFDVAVQLFAPGGYSVTVDGEPSLGERIILDGTIRFSINFDDSRSLSGRCTSFSVRQEDGEFELLNLFGLEVSAEERAALLSSFASAPRGADRSGWTDDYRVSFKRHYPAAESFHCARRRAR